MSFRSLFFLLVILLASSCLAEEFIELKIQLSKGRYYSRSKFYAERNRKLGTHFVASPRSADRLEITPIEKAALKLLEGTSAFRVKFQPNLIILEIPNSEDPKARRRKLIQLGNQLGVSLLDWPEGR